MAQVGAISRWRAQDSVGDGEGKTAQGRRQCGRWHRWKPSWESCLEMVGSRWCGQWCGRDGAGWEVVWEAAWEMAQAGTVLRWHRQWHGRDDTAWEVVQEMA